MVAQLDATHVLVTHEWSLQNPTTLYFWDVTSRKATRLADIRGPSGVRSYFPQEFTSNVSEIFWWAMDNVNTGEPSNTYVWALPKSGGQPRLVGMVELPDAPSRTGARDLSDMRATETALYWSGFAGGVYTMPVRGGKATPLTGYETYRMVAFPWATELNPANFVQENGRIFGETPGIASRLRNVLTGQEIQVVAPPHAKSLWCVPTFCVGESRDAASFAMRPDGSHVTPLPGFGYSSDDGVLDGRFAVGHPVGADEVVLVDTQTWQAGLLSVDGVGTLSGLQFWVKGGSTGVFLSAAVR